MFTRRLTMQLKPNTRAEFIKVLDSSILPLLRKQKGFHNAMIFGGSTTNEVFAISLWDGKDNAEAYGRNVYPELMKSLSSVIEGTPQLHSFELLASTLPQKAVAATA